MATDLHLGSGVTPARRKRILLVDDRAATRNSRALALCTNGYAVDWAKSVAEARTRFSPGIYHLVILDLENGFYDGVLLCREFKDISPRQTVASFHREKVAVPLPFSPDAVLSKGANSAQLLAAVHTLLPDD
jgi:DNA-binding response OmpR family regulator